MQSVKMPVLTTTGKNLFNINQQFQTGNIGGVGSSLEGEYVNGVWQVTDFIKLDSNTDYYLSTNNFKFEKISFYDINKKVIKGNNVTNVNEKLISTSNNIGYIRLVIQKKVYGEPLSYDELVANNDIQLEYGSTPTTYEPYKTNILSTPSDLVLGKVGDVEDTLNVLTGELSLKTHEITLNVTDIAVVTGSVTDRFEVTSTTKPLNNQYITTDNSGINNWGLQVINNFNWEKENTICYHANIGKFYFRFKTGLYTVETLQQKLNENPLTLRYTLTTETNKTVDLSILDQDGATVEKLNTFKDITHVSCSVDEGSIYPYVEMEVATSNDEDLAAIGLKLEEKNKVQSKLIKVNDYQSDVIDNVMLGITEIYESI